MFIADLSYLVCPFNSSPLDLICSDSKATNVDSGVLWCTQCLHWFPIVQSVPMFYRDEEREQNEIELLLRFKDKLSEKLQTQCVPFNLLSHKPQASQRSSYFEYDPEFYDHLLDSPYLEIAEIHPCLELLKLKVSEVAPDVFSNVATSYGTYYIIGGWLFSLIYERHNCICDLLYIF